MSELFLIWYSNDYGQKTLETITDNPKKWLADDNAENGLNYDLDDFEIETAQLSIYKEEE